MPASFDPYHQWLGISDPERPPNHYRLLGVDLLEADLDVIITAADRQMAHLRTFQNGPHALDSQRLLGEVAAARVCLIDPRKKAAYDAWIRTKQPPSSPPPVDLLDASSSSRPRIELTHDDKVQLQLPGRGPRNRLGWRQWSGLLVVAAILGGALFAVRQLLHNDMSLSDANVPTAESTDPTVDTGLPADPPNAAPDASGEQTTEPGSNDNATVDSPVSDTDASASPVNKTPDEPSASRSPNDPDRRAPSASDGAPLKNRRSRQAASPYVPTELESDLANAEPGPHTWNETVVAVRGEPARFSAAEPPGALLLALSRRDLVAAGSIISSWRQDTAGVIPQAVRFEAELIYDSIHQFWQSVERATSAVTVGERLQFHKWPVTVVNRDATWLELEIAPGQRRRFTALPRQIHPDLAAALVAWDLRSSLPTAWRLTATFLAVDHQGDVQRSAQYLQAAERQGFDAVFLAHALELLSGRSSIASVTPSIGNSVANGSKTSSADQGVESRNVTTTGRAPAPAPIPTDTQQQEARRTVLANAMEELKSQVPEARWAQELGERAMSDDLSPAARYVLLRAALQQATTSRDLTQGLQICASLSSQFAVDEQELREQLLRSISSGVKGEARRVYVDVALEWAAQSMMVDDYDRASRSAELAQSLGKSLRDRWYRKHLGAFRQQMNEVHDAFERTRSAAKTLNDNPDQIEAQGQMGRFLVLARGEFGQGLIYLKQASSDPVLRQLAEQELSQPATPEAQLDLAQKWLGYGRKLQGVERVRALERAQHWFETCWKDLNRDQMIQAREHLDDITKVLGHRQAEYDLTRLSPVQVSVGYGAFGANDNPDKDNPKIKPLPEVDGAKIDKFYWACAPSRIDLLVPAGATEFSALAYMNGPTTDGARFVVLVDEKPAYATPPLTAMGAQAEIQVNLPKNTRSLALVIDPIKEPHHDQAYWVRPVLKF